MSNELTTTETKLPSTNDYNPFLDAADDMGAQDSGLFLKFSGNDGTYTYGQDEEELDIGHTVAVALNLLARGWICWKDGKVVDEIMVPIMSGENPPAFEQLSQEHGPFEGERDGWQKQSYMHLRSTRTGDEFKLKLANASSNIAFGNLLKTIGTQLPFNPGKTPVISLDVTSFAIKDRKTGKKLKEKKYAPVFKIVAWKNDAELQDILDKAMATQAESDIDDDLEAQEPVKQPQRQQAQAGRKRTF